jgi:hypothetical protein
LVHQGSGNDSWLKRRKSVFGTLIQRQHMGMGWLKVNWAIFSIEGGQISSLQPNMAFRHLR